MGGRPLRRNNDSNIVPPRFDCCGNTIIELCSPTFSTPSAISRHFERCARTSAYPPEADENDAKVDMPAAMSAVEGTADVACQELSGPFLAKRRHSGTFSAAWILSIMTVTL